MKRLRDTQLTVSRVLLTIVGLLLVALAVVAALLALGWVGSLGDPLDASTPLLNADGESLIDDNALWFQLGALAVGLLLLVVGIGWLMNQVPPLRAQHDDEVADPDARVAGSNVVAGGALARALEGDLERADAVERARVEARTDDGELRIRLDLDERADLERVLADVVDPAVDRLTRVAELPNRPDVRTDVRLVEGPARRVA